MSNCYTAKNVYQITSVVFPLVNLGKSFHNNVVVTVLKIIWYIGPEPVTVTDIGNICYIGPEPVTGTDI